MTAGNEWQEKWALCEGQKSRSGNQGTVRKVVNRSTGEFGAIKLMHPEQIKSSERVARFKAEVSALRNLAEAGIPKILDDGAEGENVPYFICEWIDGRTLTHTFNGKPQELSVALGIAIQLARLLAAIHSKGIVHRDIKPDNLMIDGNGRLWLIDFGISWSENDSDEQLTVEAGSRIGNHFLVLPESAQPGVQRDTRSDITLGVGVLYYLLSGAKPVQLRDALLQSPHRNPNFLATIRNTASESQIKAINSLFDVGFAQTLVHRIQTAEEFLTRLQEIRDPREFDSSDNIGRIEESIRRYEAARRLINASIDEIEGYLVGGLKQIADAVRAIAVTKGFHGPLGNAGMSKPGKEASTLWQFKREADREPYIFYDLRACLTGANSTEVELRLTARHAPTSKIDKVYFTTSSSDHTRFISQGVAVAGEIFADALEDLASLINRGIESSS